MKREFLLIFGSQLGSAESIAGEIADTARALHYNVRLHCMNDVGVKFDLNTERVAVLVVSSTGDGDPPDNAKKLHKTFRDVENCYPNGLSHLRFALLGLGDSNYTTFHGCPKWFERHLLDAGAKPFYDTGLADDATGLELVVEPWITDLWEPLETVCEAAGQLPKLVPPPKANASPAADRSEQNGTDALPAQLAKTDKHLDELINRLMLGIKNRQGISDSPPPRSEPMVRLDCATDCQCDVASWQQSEQRPNVRYGDEAFWAANADLRVPVLPPQYVDVAVKNTKLDTSLVPWQNGAPVVGAVDSVRHVVKVITNRPLTSTAADAVSKPKYEIIVEHEHNALSYEPGDAFYFVFPNPPEEVDYVLTRLGLSDVADSALWITSMDAARQLPAYIPMECSYSYLLSNCLDIRRTPGRPVLRVLAEYCGDAEEKTRMLQLCSSQGVKEFTDLVRKAGLSLCDVLHAFPSCRPPMARLIEQLPRLLPRPYSVASSPLEMSNFVRFVYSLVTFDATPRARFYERKGLCTKWLSQRNDENRVSIIYKEPNNFRLPAPAGHNFVDVPLILIGPGTGVAPFLSFLQHIRKRTITDDIAPRSVERWLFFGCRRLEADFIYRDELQSYVDEGVLTQLHVCESRPASEGKKKRYVQDALQRQGHFVAEALTATTPNRPPAHVYVCGDALSMSKGVLQTFIQILATHADMSEDEARQFVLQMKKDNRYIEDVWT